MNSKKWITSELKINGGWNPSIVDEIHSCFEVIYNLSQNELVVLQKYINENLTIEFIWQCKSPTNALILYAKKKDGSLWMCVHYWVELDYHQ